MKENEPNDTGHLVRRLAKDDIHAFETLFTRYHKTLYSFARNLLPATIDAEEIVQNVFMAIWNQRKKLHLSSSFGAYLFGIAKHMIYDFIRQKSNIRHL
ncbi:MAG: sigma-70 family RNA polymerase sigma factor [Chloroflexia bacterium]|nr:sigma-70 family RNA polymerase sigma factor [Chloroflexia bacterium]